MIRLAFACAVAILVAGQALAADTYDVTVKVDTTKANGSPWDGIPRLGNSKVNLNAAPDIALCVVRANAKPDCLWKPQGRRLLSNCQNEWTCKFAGVALSPPVGLVIVDIDARNHDIIDALILVGNETVKADDAVADAMRTSMSILTPNRSEDSKEGVVRRAKLIPMKDCSGDKGCRLAQSEIKIEARK